MNFYKEIGKALSAVINWVSAIFNGLIDLFTPSEWSALGIAALIIFLFVRSIKRK